MAGRRQARAARARRAASPPASLPPSRTATPGAPASPQSARTRAAAAAYAGGALRCARVCCWCAANASSRQPVWCTGTGRQARLLQPSAPATLRPEASPAGRAACRRPWWRWQPTAAPQSARSWHGCAPGAAAMCCCCWPFAAGLRLPLRAGHRRGQASRTSGLARIGLLQGCIFARREGTLVRKRTSFLCRARARSMQQQQRGGGSGGAQGGGGCARTTPPRGCMRTRAHPAAAHARAPLPPLASAPPTPARGGLACACRGRPAPSGQRCRPGGRLRAGPGAEAAAGREAPEAG